MNSERKEEQKERKERVNLGEKKPYLNLLRLTARATIPSRLTASNVPSRLNGTRALKLLDVFSSAVVSLVPVDEEVSVVPI